MDESVDKTKIQNLGSSRELDFDGALTLEHFHLSEEDTGKSHTFEIFDSAPKYFLGSMDRTLDVKKNHEYLPVMKSEFSVKGQEFSIKLHPATVQEKRSREDETQIHRQYYPGPVEELVCDVILKLASQGRSAYMKDVHEDDPQPGVCVWFSLYEVQQELKACGHTHNIPRIKKAIEILSKTHLEIEGRIGDTKLTLSENFFTSLAMTTGEDWQRYGKSAKVVVRLNTLIHRSIQKGSFRLLNYERNMSLREPLARWLHKRLTLMWRGAGLSDKDTFNIMLSTIVQQSGMSKGLPVRKARIQIENAFRDLFKYEVLRDFQHENITHPGSHKNRIDDVKYTLFPTHKFVIEMVKANKREKESREAADRQKLNGKVNIQELAGKR